jgi:hypothetical protein
MATKTYLMNPMLDKSQAVVPDPDLRKAGMEHPRPAVVDRSGGHSHPSNPGAIFHPAIALWRNAWMLQGIPELNSPLAG